MAEGRIIKGIAGFYYVHVKESGEESCIYECRAKGLFRREKKKPLVGDRVELAILDSVRCIGNVTEILPRTSELIRPAVANIDQALVIFAVARPNPNLNLLDRFLVMMERQQIPVIICFNKEDEGDKDSCEELSEIYSSCGYPVFFTSARENHGVEEVKVLLKGKVTAVAGPSGVGKSTLINLFQPDAAMETGSISEKIDRGKHTTRHSELICVEDNTYIMDTPGFSSLFVNDFEKEELKEYYREFKEYEPYCRFQGCVHIHEPGCGVKQALNEGKISKVRYENYQLLYEEIKNKRRY